MAWKTGEFSLASQSFILPKKIYVTFGQNHPLRNSYIVVFASDYSKAREAVIDVLGTKWAFLYDRFEGIKDNCPSGGVGNPIQGE
jgi:hypothetical protein